MAYARVAHRPAGRREGELGGAGGEIVGGGHPGKGSPVDVVRIVNRRLQVIDPGVVVEDDRL